MANKTFRILIPIVSLIVVISVAFTVWSAFIQGGGVIGILVGGMSIPATMAYIWWGYELWKQKEQ